jgi:ATP-dependent DNA helicase RecG
MCLHPWINLDNEQLLKIAGLYGKDNATNQQGYNLAAVLLFGTDQTILNTLSYYKIDVLVRRDDLYRYDDRLYIQTNLIEAYDQLSVFTEKHLPDKFFLGGVSNANNPHGNGLLLPDNFTPFPKNPLIAKFFIQLGRVDELGSGVINVYRYLKDYSPGREPQFIEDKLFRTVIPVGGIATAPTRVVPEPNDEAINTQVKERVTREVKYIYQQGGITLSMLIAMFELTRTTAQRDIRMLKRADIVKFTGSNKSGKYILTDKGTELFNKFNP